MTGAGGAATATITLYRGINSSHPGYQSALQGIVNPNAQWWQFWVRQATPLEHNTVGGATLRSPFTSWTTNFEVAKNFALRPDGGGVVVQAAVPISKAVPSPDMFKVQLIQNNQIVREAEILVKGTVKGFPISIPPLGR